MDYGGLYLNMIDVKQLRLGNIVISDEGCDTSVTPGFFSVLLTNPAVAPCWSPVPLTEEWLLRLGFYLNDRGHEKQYGPPHDWSPCYIYWDKLSGFCFQFENYQLNYEDIKVEYVHQLQNLYFSLTGKELEIKE